MQRPLEAAPLKLDVGLLKASADAAKSSKLSAKDWKKEVEKKEKELPARLRVAGLSPAPDRTPSEPRR